MPKKALFREWNLSLPTSLAFIDRGVTKWPDSRERPTGTDLPWSHHGHWWCALGYFLGTRYSLSSNTPSTWVILPSTWAILHIANGHLHYHGDLHNHGVVTTLRFSATLVTSTTMETFATTVTPRWYETSTLLCNISLLSLWLNKYIYIYRIYIIDDLSSWVTN